MHSQLGLESTALQRRKALQRSAQSFDGEHIAKLFKYYRRQQNPYVSKDLPLALIKCKSFYESNKDLFDNFAKLASTCSFDVEPYIKYCVKCGIDESTLEAFLASTTMIEKYLVHVKRVAHRRDIYKWFLKSAKNIAKSCIDNGYFTSKDFLRMLIDTKQIGSYIVTGQISLYFFAAIPNFKKAIPKLDYFAQQELKPLEMHFDIYHSEVNKAFLQERNMYINPIDFTDKVIWKMRSRA